MERGFKRQRDVGTGRVVYVGDLSDGRRVARLELDPAVIPMEHHAAILRMLDRFVLRPVDPALQVEGRLPPGAVPPMRGRPLVNTPVGDPYSVGPRRGE